MQQTFKANIIPNDNHVLYPMENFTYTTFPEIPDTLESAKNILQQLCQNNSGWSMPHYVSRNYGPNHCSRWCADIRITYESRDYKIYQFKMINKDIYMGKKTKAEKWIASMLVCNIYLLFEVVDMVSLGKIWEHKNLYSRNSKQAFPDIMDDVSISSSSGAKYTITLSTRDDNDDNNNDDDKQQQLPSESRTNFKHAQSSESKISSSSSTPDNNRDSISCSPPSSLPSTYASDTIITAITNSPVVSHSEAKKNISISIVDLEIMMKLGSNITSPDGVHDLVIGVLSCMSTRRTKFDKTQWKIQKDTNISKWIEVHPNYRHFLHLYNSPLEGRKYAFIYLLRSIVEFARILQSNRSNLHLSNVTIVTEDDSFFELYGQFAQIFNQEDILNPPSLCISPFIHTL